MAGISFIQNSFKSNVKTPQSNDYGVLFITTEGSIELSLVLTGSFRLLLTLQAGAHVMLSLLDLLNNASLGAGTLEALQSRFQRFILFHVNFRH